MNLTFFLGSKRLAASIRPMFPSLIRSRNESPHPRYFLAKLTTKRRFASTSFLRASLSPLRTLAPSFFSSSAVIRGSLEISCRYFFRLWELEPPRCVLSCSSIRDAFLPYGAPRSALPPPNRRFILLHGIKRVYWKLTRG